MLPKNPTYTFIQTYTFISFQQKFPPICLFPPILLLVFEEISHLYFYSDSSSIRNYRVVSTIGKRANVLSFKIFKNCFVNWDSPNIQMRLHKAFGSVVQVQTKPRPLYLIAIKSAKPFLVRLCLLHLEMDLKVGKQIGP